MKRQLKNLKTAFFALILGGTLFAACEREFIPELQNNADQIVVEGYIEAGDNPTPPFVILTKSIPFFKTFNTGNSNLYVHDATVWMSDGTDSVQLFEICWSRLDSATRRLIAPILNVDIDSVGQNFDLCIYGDITQRVRPTVGKTYSLRVEKDGKKLTAQTKIPPLVRMTGSFIKPPGTNLNDTMMQMRGNILDPANERNYYRYFTSVNGSTYQAGGNSVISDDFFDGKNTTFNLTNTAPNRSIKQGEFGLFKKGDSVSIKYCTIDEAHFNFWNTLDFNNNNQGPFSSYTRVKFNVVGEGGMGIWGGYGITYYETVVPK